MSLRPEEGRVVRIPNEEITWAGDCPWSGGYCFGTESGRLLFYSELGEKLALDFDEVLAEAAINGVAFYKEFIGVSTRNEVVVHRRVPGGAFDLVFSGPGGAHGILATPIGQFLAPLGPEGLCCVDVAGKGPPRAWNEQRSGVSLNHYSLTRLGNAAGKEILACAGRSDGLLRLQFDAADNDSLITRLMVPDVDFLDVCSLGSTRWPFAVAALCLDRSIILLQDLLTDDQPQTLRVDGIKGTPYSILCATGHLFVLTSHHVTVLPNLAPRYLDGERLSEPLHFRQRSVRADDMFIARGRELLVLTDEGVQIDSIPQLVGSSTAAEHAGLQSNGRAWIENEGDPAIGPSPAHWVPVPA